MSHVIVFNFIIIYSLIYFIITSFIFNWQCGTPLRMNKSSEGFEPSLKLLRQSRPSYLMHKRTWWVQTLSSFNSVRLNIQHISAATQRRARELSQTCDWATESNKKMRNNNKSRLDDVCRKPIKNVFFYYHSKIYTLIKFSRKQVHLSNLSCMSSSITFWKNNQSPTCLYWVILTTCCDRSNVSPHSTSPGCSAISRYFCDVTQGIDFSEVSCNSPNETIASTSGLASLAFVPFRNM